MCEMNRLKELIESLGLSPEEFARLFEVSKSSIYRYAGINKTEPREIPAKLANKICDRYNLSMDWLHGNDAEKYRDAAANALIGMYWQLSDDGKKELLNYADYISRREKENNG
jgi:transcriptional regulator with XRE-family HTH domain